MRAGARRALVVVTLLGASCLPPSPARADIAPPRGYVETCSVDGRAQPGETCQACRAWFGGREPCDRLRDQGFTFRCRSHGASVWSEVWCRPDPLPPPPPRDPEAGTAGGARP